MIKRKFQQYLMDSTNKYFRKYLKKNWTFGRYMKMKRFFLLGRFAFNLVLDFWINRRMEMVSSLEHTRCLKYKRVDFRFQILVPVLM
ncbi:unnamed protein product [Rhizophagus irregularis]|nr:unnamed protein product [Rhizophagus irregularis]